MFLHQVGAVSYVSGCKPCLEGSNTRWPFTIEHHGPCEKCKLSSDWCIFLQVGSVVIVHTHGPKPEMSLCVIDYLNKNLEDKRHWEPPQVMILKDELVQHCNIHVALYMDELLQIMAGAFKVVCTADLTLRCCVAYTNKQGEPESLKESMCTKTSAGRRRGTVSMGAPFTGSFMSGDLLEKEYKLAGINEGKQEIHSSGSLS